MSNACEVTFIIGLNGFNAIYFRIFFYQKNEKLIILENICNICKLWKILF